jgi:hypothetical protein
MGYVWACLAISAFNAIAACVAYVWFPASRDQLMRENHLVENISALTFLCVALLGFAFFLRLRRRGAGYRILLVTSVAGLLGLLEEVSFGEKIFGLPMPMIGETQQMDGLHDLFDLGVGPHLTVEQAESSTERLIQGNSRGFCPTFAPSSGPKRALRTTFRSTTV